jgi:hypothetical protein
LTSVFFLSLPFQNQIKSATEFLVNEMGQMVNRTSRDKVPINLSKEEITQYIKRFQLIDKENKGYVSINDIRRTLKVIWGWFMHAFDKSTMTKKNKKSENFFNWNFKNISEIQKKILHQHLLYARNATKGEFIWRVQLPFGFFFCYLKSQSLM